MPHVLLTVLVHLRAKPAGMAPLLLKAYLLLHKAARKLAAAALPPLQALRSSLSSRVAAASQCAGAAA